MSDQRMQSMVSPYAKRFFTFGLIGGASTVLQFVVLAVLVEYFSVRPVLASSLGYCASGLLNYLFNYRYTFASTLPHAIALSRFAAVSLAGLAINSGMMALLLSANLEPYWVAQVFASGTVLLWNFWMSLHWSFRSRPPR